PWRGWTGPEYRRLSHRAKPPRDPVEGGRTGRPLPDLLLEEVRDAESTAGASDAELPIRETTPPNGSEGTAEIERGTPGQGPEAAVEVDHDRGGDLLALSPEREAVDPETGDELRKLRRELPDGKAFGAEEDAALRRMAIEVDLEAKVESLESSSRGAPVARGERTKGHERSFPRAEGGLRGPPRRSEGGVKGVASRSEARSEAEDP